VSTAKIYKKEVKIGLLPQNIIVEYLEHVFKKL
jgi:hypothetical protein